MASFGGAVAERVPRRGGLKGTARFHALDDPSDLARGAALIAGAGVVMLGLFALARTGLIDDAYITLAYAKNLALHLHWGLTPHELSNTETSPLNVVLLAALTEITRIGGGAHPVIALGILSVALAMITAWGLWRIVRALELPLATAVIGVVLVLANPLVLSALGLEVLLIPAVLALLLATAVEERPGWFGVVAGLSLLSRLDLVVFPLVIAIGVPAIRRHWTRALAGTVLVAAPWFLFSWVALGSFVPDSGLIKLSQSDAFRPWGFANGPVLYYRRFPSGVALAFLPALIGLCALAAWAFTRVLRRRLGRPALPLGAVAAVGGGGVVYYLALAALRLPPYHWYYVPPIVALTIFLALFIGVWLRSANRTRLPIVLLAAAVLIAGATVGRDLAYGVPWRTPPVTSNWATARDYARIGVALKKKVGPAPVASADEVGTLAYYCDCRLVDMFSDRGLAVQMINRRIDGTNPLFRIAYKLNFLWLDRRQRPQRIRYRLVYVRGPGSGRNTWQVWSPWKGVGHLTLVRLAKPVEPRP
jgi:hypothetical protein